MIIIRCDFFRLNIILDIYFEKKMLLLFVVNDLREKMQELTLDNTLKDNVI
jgi:hypothetical protein